MQINFSNIVPFHIAENKINDSEVWGNNILLQKGEKVLLIGESGAGKSTLLNIILGERYDYSGVLFINDQDIKQFTRPRKTSLRQLNLSILPQGLMMFGHLNAFENIQVNNRINDFLDEKEILNMMETLGVLQYRNKKSATLSFGENQRLAIIRSLCQPFDFLLLDEPFSHLDKYNTDIAWDMIVKHANQQRAGILITALMHNPDIEYSRKLYV